MAVCSYIIHPVDGRLEALIANLNAIESCDVIPADNGEAVILVTEPNSDEEEEHLQATLKGMNEIECMALTFGQVHNRSK